jgi:hypothetical protein
MRSARKLSLVNSLFLVLRRALGYMRPASGVDRARLPKKSRRAHGLTVRCGRSSYPRRRAEGGSPKCASKIVRRARRGKCVLRKLVRARLCRAFVLPSGESLAGLPLRTHPPVHSWTSCRPRRPLLAKALDRLRPIGRVFPAGRIRCARLRALHRYRTTNPSIHQSNNKVYQRSS